MTWEDVGRVACELPGVEASTSYGTPAYKVKKALLVRLKEDGASIVLFRSFDEKEFLLEAAPEVFFQTDHYKNYPALLAHLDTLEAAELRRILTDTWRAKAPKSLLKVVDQGGRAGG